MPPNPPADNQDLEQQDLEREQQLEQPKPGEEGQPGKPGDKKPEDEVELGAPALAFIERALGTAKPRKKPAKTPPADELDTLHKPKRAPKAEPVAQPLVPVIDEERLGEAIGRAMKKGEPPPPPPDAPPELDDPEMKKKLQMYQRLEQSFPDKYKDYPKKFVANARKWTDYVEQWEKDNPDQEFKEDDEEHEKFRSTLEAQTEYDEDDNVAALANQIADGKVAKVKEEMDQQFEPIRRREALERSKQTLFANRDAVGDRFWDRLGEGFEGVLDKNGKLVPQALDELKAADPAAHSVAVNGAALVENLGTEIFLLDNKLTPFDARNPNHQFLLEFQGAAEDKMLRRAAAKQVNEAGQRFAPRREFNRMTPEQRHHYWTFNYEDLGYLLAAQVAKQTRDHLQVEQNNFSIQAGAKGLLQDPPSLPDKSRRPGQRAPAPHEESDDKPLSPSTPNAPRLASLRGRTTAAPGNALSAFVSRATRGR